MTRPVAFIVTCVVGLMAPAVASAGFVQRSGTNLTLNASSFRFVGDNNYQLTSMTGKYVCGRAMSDATLDQVLGDAKAAGATVIRTWFFQSYFRGGANSYAPFDRVLDEAAAKGLRVIPVLVNHYPDCEPSGGKRKDETFYDSGYKSAGWGYAQSYRDYARTVAAHYKSNEAIAFWQLVNEAETTTSGGGCNTTVEANGHQHSANVLRRFVDDMGAVVHAADPNHLVSLGTIGGGQCGAANADYRYVHESPGTDLCEYHDYNNAATSMPGDQWNGLAVRISQCNAIGKPMLIGESGIVADADTYGGSSGSITTATLQRRADFFSVKLNAAFDNGVDGYLLWEKIPDASSSPFNRDNGRYGIGPSDPLNAVTLAKALQLAGGTVTGGGGTGGGTGGGAGTGGAGTPTVRADFEDGTLQSWELGWGTLGLASSTEQHFTGAKSLKLSDTAGGWPAARMRTATGASAGTTITLHVYRPATAPATVGVIPLVTDAGWSNTYGPEVALASGWNTVTFAVPAGIATPLQAIGVQVADHGWLGAVYVDAVAW